MLPDDYGHLSSTMSPNTRMVSPIALSAISVNPEHNVQAHAKEPATLFSYSHQSVCLYSFGLADIPYACGERVERMWPARCYKEPTVSFQEKDATCRLSDPVPDKPEIGQSSYFVRLG
jgi:hypothetical protein